MKSRDIIRALEADGWPDQAGQGDRPAPENDVPIGTVKSIEKQAGIILR